MLQGRKQVMHVDTAFKIQEPIQGAQQQEGEIRIWANLPVPVLACSFPQVVHSA